MIHPDTRLCIISEAIGYGVRATTFIPKGTIVFVKDELDVSIDETQYEYLPAQLRDLAERYSYREADGTRILSWDHAKYVNHSCECNTMSTGYGFEIAIKDINPGEEITDEYGLFNVEEEMELYCSCVNCRKRLRVSDLEVYHERWDQLTHEALAVFDQVKQPLWPIVDESTQTRVLRAIKGVEPFASVRELVMAASQFTTV